MAEEGVSRSKLYRLIVEAPSQESTAPRTRRYDVEMIRDFLAQLRLEVELLYDYDARFNPDDPGYSRPADLYSAGATDRLRKYGTSLLPGSLTFGEECTPDSAPEAYARYVLLNVRQLWEELQHLKALEPLFEEALFCAAQEGKVRTELDCAAVLGEADPR